MTRKLLLSIMILFVLTGCSKGDTEFPTGDEVFEKPTEILEVASTDEFQFTSNNISVGIFNFDNDSEDPLALFDAEFSSITYNGFTNELCFTVTVNDDDYTHSEYRYELHSVDLEYKRTSGMFYAMSATAVQRVCIDSVNDGGLWEIIMYKTTDSTDAFVQEAHGFFFQVHEFENRESLIILFEQNLDLPFTQMEDSIEFHLRINTEATVNSVQIVATDHSINEEVYSAVFDAEAYTVNDGVIDITATVYLLDGDSNYEFKVFVNGSDSVVEYSSVLVKEMIFHTE